MQKISGIARSLGVHTLQEQCPIHHVPLQAIGKHKACPVCTKQGIDQEKQKLIRQQALNSTQGMLYHDSLPADKEEFERATFKEFKTEPGTLPDRCKQLARQIAGQYLKYHGKWTFNDQKADITHVTGALKDRADGFNTVLTGKPGSGKTHLATSIIKAVNDHSGDKQFAGFYQKCLFISIVTLMQHVKKSWTDDTYKWTDDYAEKLLKRADLLVIDDLGSESRMQNGKEAKQWVQAFLMRVFEGQHRVIITTNLTIAELHETYNAKLVSRMLAGSQGHIIDFNGIQDNRREAPDETNLSLF
jgi:DNA replication protein DnaC